MGLFLVDSKLIAIKFKNIKPKMQNENRFPLLLQPKIIAFIPKGLC